ncbi:MAG: hypothetical protein Q9166_005689 [cf. Caloplaca sp. 2 TL-2023]
MDASESKLPLHEDIMQLARLGEIGPIQNLLEEGKFTADYKDAENITPLHWAAINNHYALCQFLIEQGADVNAIGGISEATPAHWAIQRCHYYTVSLLLRRGANPNIGDGLGYKMIHLATFDGNAFMLLIILLHPSVSVDEPDRQGHTALMWAAYNRLPAIVDLLLRFGASVHTMDETSFQPLHWALVRGSPPCILKLLENGADRFAVTSTDKTPVTIAEELKTTQAWHRALKESGFNHDATVKQLPIPYISFIKSRKFFMRGHLHQGSPASEVITSALTAGTTSLNGASLTNAGMGPDPAIPAGPEDHAHPHKEGYLAQWKKLLGLDTFIATATGRSGRRKRGNPFSRGVYTNCKDFWFDPAPFFGRRENGSAMLNGEVINYTSMYETPRKMKMRRPRDAQGSGMYQRVDTEDTMLVEAKTQENVRFPAIALKREELVDDRKHYQRFAVWAEDISTSDPARNCTSWEEGALKKQYAALARTKFLYTHM